MSVTKIINLEECQLIK